ncbi:MAG: response regulator [Burkholderiaceae bacterium]
MMKILVVDDSPTERWFMTDRLARAGYQVAVAVDGEEALAKARTDPPGLIVLDIVMPGLSGFQITRSLSRDPMTRDIPVILCSSKSTETDRIWGLRQGARDYLTKPVHPEELLARVAQLARPAEV